MWFGFISKILVFSLVHSNGTQTNQLLKLVVNKKTKQNYNMLNMQDAKRHKNTINLQTLEKKTYTSTCETSRKNQGELLLL
jgi:hypothetical protein